VDDGNLDPLPPGYHLGRFVIESELAPASLGRVYKARDTSLGQVIALNVLAVDLRNDEGKRRLRAGLRRARQKASPQAYEYGEWQGIPYVVVAYAEGLGAVVDVGEG
jgi:serine/threonine protein kinase